MILFLQNIKIVIIYTQFYAILNIEERIFSFEKKDILSSKERYDEIMFHDVGKKLKICAYIFIVFYVFKSHHVFNSSLCGHYKV